jgi:hypothetical protein
MREPLSQQRGIGKRELLDLLQPVALMIGVSLPAAGHYPRAFKDFRLSSATQWQGR